MSQQTFEFGFQFGSFEYTDTLPWVVWGQVPKPNRQEVLKEYQDAMGSFVEYHVPRCRSCAKGFFDVFGNHVRGPCYVFGAIGSAIRRTWHAKLIRSIKIMRSNQQAARLSQ